MTVSVKKRTTCWHKKENAGAVKHPSQHPSRAHELSTSPRVPQNPKMSLHFLALGRPGRAAQPPSRLSPLLTPLRPSRFLFDGSTDRHCCMLATRRTPPAPCQRGRSSPRLGTREAL